MYMYNVQCTMYTYHLSELPVLLGEELHPGPQLPVLPGPGLLPPAPPRPRLKIGHSSLDTENKSLFLKPLLCRQSLLCTLYYHGITYVRNSVT